MAQIRLLLYPDFIEVKEKGTEDWHSINYSKKFYSGSIRLKSNAYLLFVDVYGQFSEIDTSGILDIGVLEKLAWKNKKNVSFNALLRRELEHMDEKSMPILSFDRAVERCRCIGNIMIFGSSDKTYVTKKGCTVFWNGINPDKKYQFQLLNYFGDALEIRNIKWNEPQLIDSTLNGHFRRNENKLSENNLIISIGNEDESESISVSLISDEMYEQYERDLRYIQIELKNKQTIMEVVADFILLDKYQLYLNSAEKYYAIFNTLKEKYGNAYDNFFYKIPKQSFRASYLMNDINKKSVEIKVNMGDPLPMLQEEVLLKSFLKRKEYAVGTAKVVKIIGNTVTLEFVEIFTGIFMKDNEIRPGVFNKAKGTILWKR